MILIDGKKYAETNDEFVNSIFEPEDTCEGRAERHKRKIMFRNVNGRIDYKINYNGILLTQTGHESGDETYYPVWISPE